MLLPTVLDRRARAAGGSQSAARGQASEASGAVANRLQGPQWQPHREEWWPLRTACCGLLHKHATRRTMHSGCCTERMAATHCRPHRQLETSNGAANRAASSAAGGIHLGAVQEGGDLPHKGVWVLERHQLCGEREAEAGDVAPLTVLLQLSGTGECCWTILPRPSPRAIMCCLHSAPVGINIPILPTQPTPNLPAQASTAPKNPLQQPHMPRVRHLHQAGSNQLCCQLCLGAGRDDSVLAASHQQDLAAAVAQLRHQAGTGVKGVNGLTLRVRWAREE